ncbi:MAG: glutamate--cysteine ligase [Proteobacteria bacterium]|nr:glutamate--cysteine ligase [Pseudomonadota bacterium]MDA1301009.1 glutamate--cysteine ligase [Pseudomonadota bacterium]
MIDALKRLAASNPDALTVRRGIERETLRVDPDGKLALTPHPAFLGSKLCHPLITTDFSESQLELITSVATTAEQALKQLEDIHRFIYSNLEGELLWPASMPSELPANDDIPLARFGQSNQARFKTTYRSGLGHRYGRTMQTICAVHYNFSLPDSFWTESAGTPGKRQLVALKNERYFDLMRNFRRWSWLPIYLFGASPAVSDSFVRGRSHGLQSLGQDTWYLPGATSLRSGGLGYQSDIQAGLIDICYNSLGNYIRSIATAICTEHEDYRRLSESTAGIIQLNHNILQLEAEFYSTVRAKRVARGGSVLGALASQGVEYIEVRLLDLDPFTPLGIAGETIDFLDVFLLYCLMADSPVHDDALCRSVGRNMDIVVQRGRANPALDNLGDAVTLSDWGLSLISELEPIAHILDGIDGSNRYSESIAVQAASLRDPDRTPSARLLEGIDGGSFHQFALERARLHREAILAQPIDSRTDKQFRRMSEASMAELARLEHETQTTFETYIEARQQEYVNLLRDQQ